MKVKLYEDRVGNVLWKEYQPQRNIWQFFATNAEGRVITRKGFQIMIKRAKQTSKISGLPDIKGRKSIKNFRDIDNNIIGTYRIRTKKNKFSVNNTLNNILK